MNTAAALEHIRRRWGITAWRPLQVEAIRAHLEDRDSLVIMPTGSGKSLCYQGPAVVMPGTVVVVSPLIALMKDQVDSLERRQISAAFLNSTQLVHEQIKVEHLLLAGELRLLYVSPERFASPAFMALLLDSPIRSVVVDEAHCISQWGSDFRPDYAKLGEKLAALRSLKTPALTKGGPGGSPFSIHAYTATATPEVRAEITES
ncbi:MAG: DEAD/DEAH box helicase, partial [Planctomycetes bacterium]|nr:DEAD/DEAH box helicase [Planctomycetota bacterium]